MSQKPAALFVVAVAVFVIVWLTRWRSTDLVAILLFSLCVENLTSLGMNRIAAQVHYLLLLHDPRRRLPAVRAVRAVVLIDRTADAG